MSVPQLSLGSVDDAFSSLAYLYVEREKARASQPAATNVNDYNTLSGARDDVTQRVNVNPAAPSTINATGANAGRTVNVGGIAMNKTALYVGGGALLAAGVLKLAKVI